MTPQNSPVTAARTAAVIGADPMGVTAALGLLAAGFEVALYSDHDRRNRRVVLPCAAVIGSSRRNRRQFAGGVRPALRE
jgi:2-polyprenyl-6-methoxyphenol hydroxylase-like FAD-dependent oxidoreductase